jgi:hypothetical protein
LGKLLGLERGVYACLKSANNTILGALIERRADLNLALRAQEELMMIAKVLTSYMEGNVELSRRSEHPVQDVVRSFYHGDIDGRKILFRLVTRPKEVSTGNKDIDGEACIRFTIEPYSSRIMGFRIDRVYSESLRRYVVVIDLEGPNLKRIGDYHHPLPDAGLYHEIAREEIFAELVRAFRRK